MKEYPEHVSDVTGGSHRSDGQQLIISVLPRHFPRCCSTAEAPHHHSLHIRTESERWIAGKSERERELPHSMTQPLLAYNTGSDSDAGQQLIQLMVLNSD